MIPPPSYRGSRWQNPLIESNKLYHLCGTAATLRDSGESRRPLGQYQNSFLSLCKIKTLPNMNLVLAVKWCTSHSTKKGGGGVITERFLIGSMGRGVSRAKAQKGELVELTSMVKLDTICSIVYHWYQHPMPEILSHAQLDGGKL